MLGGYAGHAVSSAIGAVAGIRGRQRPSVAGDSNVDEDGVRQGWSTMTGIGIGFMRRFARFTRGTLGHVR
jgi:hypothetical protein